MWVAKNCTWAACMSAVRFNGCHAFGEGNIFIHGNKLFHHHRTTASPCPASISLAAPARKKRIIGSNIFELDLHMNMQWHCRIWPLLGCDFLGQPPPTISMGVAMQPIPVACWHMRIKIVIVVVCRAEKNCQNFLKSQMIPRRSCCYYWLGSESSSSPTLHVFVAESSKINYLHFRIAANATADEWQKRTGTNICKCTCLPFKRNRLVRPSARKWNYTAAALTSDRWTTSC